MLVMLLIKFLSAAITLSFAASNKIYKFFSIYWIGIFLLSFSVTLLIIKFGNYPQILSLDHFLYKIIINIKLLPSTILRIYNVGYAIIMISSICIYFSLSQKNTVNILIVVFLGMLTMAFLLLNDPSFKLSYYIYSNYQSGLPKNKIFMNWENSFKLVSLCIIILFAVLPVNVLLKATKRTMLRTICDFHVVCALILILFDLHIAIVFLCGSFKAFSPPELNLLSIPRIDFSQINFRYPVIFSSVSSLAIMLIIFFSRPFKSKLFFLKKDIENQEYFFNKNINILIHSDKNAFVIIKKFASLTQNELSNKEQAYRLLNEIISRSEKSISQLNDVTNALNTHGVPFTETNICECLDAALTKAAVPENITVVTNYDLTDEITVNANIDLLSEAFYNIIDNAVSSLRSSNKNQLCIKILIEVRNKSLFIEFEDNGVGISHQDQKSIFKEFYSTKNSTSNLGLGLSSVKKIINLHKGMIRVKSILGKYTCFCIILPLNG